MSIGYNCGKLRRYSEAIEAYKQVLWLRPDFAEAWYNIGLFEYYLRYFPDAITAAERASAIDPQYDEPYVVLGIARGEIDDLAGGIEALKKAIDLSPSLMEARVQARIAPGRCDHHPLNDPRSSREIATHVAQNDGRSDWRISREHGNRWSAPGLRP